MSKIDITDYFPPSPSCNKRPLSTSSESDNSPTTAKNPAKKLHMDGQQQQKDTSSELDGMRRFTEILTRLEARIDKLSTKTDVHDVREDVKKLGDSMMERIDELEGKVLDLEMKTEKTDKTVKVAVSKTESTLNVVRQQEQRIQALEKEQNDLQQYSRRWNIRVYKIPESKDVENCAKKVCRVFTDMLGIQTDEKEIELAHRTGQPSPDKSRPILVRFFDRKKRDLLLSKRRNLKHKGVSIDEDLTLANYRLSQTAHKHSSSLAVWSSNGKILAKLKNGRTVRLNIHSNVDELFKRMMESKDHDMSDAGSGS